MKLSSSWLKNMLRRTMLNDQQIVEALERAGMEVDQIISSKGIDKKVVVGLVKKVVQHPGANRLRLVDVAVGERVYRVVCGASNVREGLKVALAQIGTTLPGGERIEKAKLRGEVSEGMLCSERELNLGSDHNGILELSSEMAVGTRLCDIFPADAVIDLKTPANRFDVLSVWGLAREVAAMTTAELVPLSPPPVKPSEAGPGVLANAKAARYMLGRVSVDQSTPSPGWMQSRLRAAGMRSVSPVVDVTNYVMLELGQPLHAFDAAKVTLPVSVRLAHQGESLTTLDGVKRELTPEDLVIVDKSGPIALAGVMGGAATEVGPETREILLEAAVFDATTVRKTAKRHGLRTEASARFERGVPVELAPLAVARAVELLGEVAQGKAGALTDQLNRPTKPRSITLSLSVLRKLLGFGVTHKEAADALKKLQIGVGESSKDEIAVPQVPWWRPDLELPEDVVEEVVRVLGYERVPSTIPSWRPKLLRFDRVRAKRRLIQEVLYGAGLFEVMTYSFVALEQLESLGLEPSEHLKLKNPLSIEQAYLRSSLLASHLAVLERNRMYAKEAGFYEISSVFVKQGSGEQPQEPVRLAITIRRPEAAYVVAKGVLDVVGRVLNVELEVAPQDAREFVPGRGGDVRLEGRSVGRIGQLHPDLSRAHKVDGEVAYAEVELSPLLEASRPRQFAGVSRFPVIQRDLSVVVPYEVTWRRVLEVLAPERPEFVDDYLGAGLPAGHKGLTLRLTVANPDRTPTEAEANDLEARIYSRLERKLGAKRREPEA
jgi:phenylalanyl-tRNA synthetase beta chain